MATLPHFNPDADGEPLPAAVANLRAQVAAADAVLFCTPEYAGALPGTFKNLLEKAGDQERPLVQEAWKLTITKLQEEGVD